MLTVTQIVLIFYGHKLSERFKLQVLWVIAGFLLFVVPFVAINLGKSAGFGVVFVLLLMFGICNGIL